MATNNNQNGWLSIQMGYGAQSLSVVPEQQSGGLGGGSGGGSSTEVNQFEEMERAATGSSTLKRNPKMELTKSDLLKLVTYFEGEIQARDIAIAALKSEKLKQVVNVGRYRPVVMSDPYTALLRDSIADGPTAKPAVNERDIAAAADQQLQALEQLAIQQKQAHEHMVNILKDAEAKHKKVIQELEEEKCKHEHDTAQGDDITYGLEMERTRLRQELEVERTARKKLEKEVKRQQEIADEERARQKQIVLLLLAERKKIIVKYIEERKRSEDLAQILSEEKSKIDSMAEGLEEESKKSLQMEAELEKQLNVFEAEKKITKATLATRDLRCQEMESDLVKLRAECEALRIRSRETVDSGATTSAAPMTSSVAKVVQPTATVSSVPVSGPTTGIAQSVAPGQALRQTAICPPAPSQLKISTATSIMGQQDLTAPTSAPTPLTGVSARAACATGNPSTVVIGAAASSTPPALHNKISAYSAAVGGPSTPPPQTPPKKGVGLLGRGVPPPIPPNKPVIVPSGVGSTSAISGGGTTTGGVSGAARPPPMTGTTRRVVTAATTTVSAATANTTTSAHTAVTHGDSGMTDADKKKVNVKVTATPTPTLSSNGGIASTVAAGSGQRHLTGGIEMLAHELADFQQMLVTMATSNNT